MWTQYPIEYAPKAIPVMGKDGKAHAGPIPTHFETADGMPYANPDAVAYGIALFFARLRGQGLSHMAWLVRHELPNRAQRRKALREYRRGKA